MYGSNFLSPFSVLYLIIVSFVIEIVISPHFFATFFLPANASANAGTASSSSFLSYQWNGGGYTELGKNLEHYQSYCHDENEIYHHGMHNNGMGSELFVYGQALCNCMQWNVSMNLAALNNDRKIWYWNDKDFCNQNISIYNDRADPKFLETYVPKKSPLECYFNKKNPCHEVERDAVVFIPSLNKLTGCPKFVKNLNERAVFRDATIEFMFSNMSRQLVNETEVKAEELFKSLGYSQIPKDMITVHVRWGDKSREMSLVSIDQYLDTVAQIIANESIAHPHVHLVSESNLAATQMRNNIEARNKKNNASWKFTTFGQPPIEARKMEHMAYTSHGRYVQDSM